MRQKRFLFHGLIKLLTSESGKTTPTFPLFPWEHANVDLTRRGRMICILLLDFTRFTSFNYVSITITLLVWQWSNFDTLNFSLNNRPQHEAMGNKPHKLCSYSPEPRAEVYCFKLNFNIYKIGLLQHRQQSKFSVPRKQLTVCWRVHHSCV